MGGVSERRGTALRPPKHSRRFAALLLSGN
jgi:hypothetical protein